MRMRISVYLQSGMAAFYFFVFFTDLCEQIDIGLTVFSSAHETSCKHTLSFSWSRKSLFVKELVVLGQNWLQGGPDFGLQFKHLAIQNCDSVRNLLKVSEQNLNKPSICLTQQLSLIICQGMCYDLLR